VKRAALLALAGAALHLAILPREYRERSDLPAYLDASLRWATGETPYKEFPFEYPPAALLIVRAPLHAAALTGIRYETAFALWMALFDALALFAAWLSGRRWSAMAICWAGLALCNSVLYTRFDLAPGALMALAVALACAGQFAGAGAVLGVAAALKLYPLFIAPVLAVAAFRAGRLRVALLAGAAAALLLSLPAFGLDFLGYHWSRGIQIQSLWGALLRLAGRPDIVHRFGAEEVAGAPAFLGPLSLLFQIAAAAAAAWRFRDVRAGALAAFAGFVAFAKVGSPQFMVALVPLATIPGAARFVLAACVLMAWEFPFHYSPAERASRFWAAVDLARMLLLASLAGGPRGRVEGWWAGTRRAA
jgi:hypothetical protein